VNNEQVNIKIGKRNAYLNYITRRTDAKGHVFIISLDIDTTGANIVANILKPNGDKILDAENLTVLDHAVGRFKYKPPANTYSERGTVEIDFTLATPNESLTTPKIRFEVVEPIDAVGGLPPEEIEVFLGVFMHKSVYDSNNNGKVDLAEHAENTPWDGVQNKPTAFPPSAHVHNLATQLENGFMSSDDKTKVDNIPNIDAQLAQTGQQVTQLQTDKLDKNGFIAINQIDKNRGLIDESYLSDTLKAQMAGTTAIGSTPPPRSIRMDQLAFYKMGKNLFNKDTVVLNHFVNQTNGLNQFHETFNVSDFIEVEPNTQYARKEDLRTAFYNESKTFISGFASAGSLIITTPANAKYMKCTLYASSLNTFQVEKGDVSTGYEAFQIAIRKEFLEEKSFNANNIPDGAIPFQKNEAISRGKNMFDKINVIQNVLISTLNGTTLSPNNNYVTSYFMKVKPSTVYAHEKRIERVVFYNADQTFISGDNSAGVADTFITPSNCEFIRFSVWKPKLDLCMLEENSNPTLYEPYGFKFSKEPKLPSLSLEINLPPTIYSLVGQETNVYFDNIINDRDTKYDFSVACSIGRQETNRFTVIPTTEGTRTLKIDAYRDGVLVATASSSLIVKAVNVGNGVNRKVLFIGDSTTASGIAISKLNDNLTPDVMKITTIGTKGTSPSKHEAVSGWSTSAFFGTESPFVYNGVFNFSQYMTNNGYSNLDYVFINLGINDMFNETEGTLNSKIATVLGQYQQMVDSIKAYDGNIKIGLVITIPPNYNQDAFGKDYGTNQTRINYKRNNFAWVKSLINQFKGKQVENIYLVPINVNLDTRTGFGTVQEPTNTRNPTLINKPASSSGVHPIDVGYHQIADMYWYYLKSFEA
jgi:lysophospholipase L1-like esterase